MASLYDSASLVMIPSGVKDGKAYSIKPTDGSGDFTFSRGTGTATRVNASGLIEKERSNQLLQSNTFDTSWTGSSTPTSGQSGYDGSSDAWLLAKPAASFSSINQITTATGVLTFSVYVKQGSFSTCTLRVIGSNDHNTKFDLTDGSVISTGGTASIDTGSIDIGNGWYRLFITISTTSGLQVIIYPDGITATTAGNILIQDAQLEQGLVATDYIETTTAAVYEGITDNLPRLDYSGGASCPSLLLESSRTNGFAHSEYFNAWDSLNNVSITPNSATSPEGVQNASLMTASTAGLLTRSVRIGSQSTTTDVKTMSVYAKANTHDYIQLFHSGDAQAYVNFDLSSGAVGTSGTNGTGDIEPMGNDWYRCIATFDSGANFGSSLYIGLAASASASYGGTGISDTSLSVYIFGAQYEAGNYATSIIPTYGTAASRAADSCALINMITNGIGTSGAYSVLVEVDVDENASGDNSVVLSLAQDESLASVEISLNAYEQQESGRMRITSATDGTITYLNSPNTRKYAFSVDGTNVVATDESSVKNDTLSVSGNSLGSLRLSYGTSERTISMFKQLIIVPSVLTSAEMLTFTQS